MIRADWPPVFRYGFSVLLFTALIAIALLLRYSHIDINLTIPVVIGLIAATWWGGRGPGLVFVFLVIAATVVLATSLRDHGASRYRPRQRKYREPAGPP